VVSSGEIRVRVQKHFALYPIVGVTRDFLEDPFDDSVLPAQIVPGVTIEDARKLFPEDSFKLWSEHLAKRQLDSLKRVRFVIVNRYDEFNEISGQTQQQAEGLAWNVGLCLRLIRPMQQDASLIGGTVMPDGSLYVQRFENPEEMTVLSVQKLFRLRNKDVDRLKVLAPMFLSAIKGKSKFQISAEFFNAGYFSTRYWQARFSLWCTALEALFTSSHKDHQGSRVAKERIKFLLGSKMPIYEPGDIPSDQSQPNNAVEDVLDDLYKLRNCMAHGDYPPERFWEIVRQDYADAVTRIEMLNEALSRVVRASLLRILEDGLLPHFQDGPSSQSYFAAHKLTKPDLLKGKKR
jgi:hypothetical protein